jgi:putative copper resistance protein D
VSTWDIDVAASLVCGLLLGGYAVCVFRRHGGEHQRWRSACFVVGVGVLWLSRSSGLAVYGRELFWLHMVLHLTLIMIVPALFVLGSPLRVVMDAGAGRWMARARSILTSLPVSVALHPASGLAVYTAVIVGTHLTSFMDQMTVHGWLEPLEVVLYVFGGWLLLTPLLGAEPIRWRVPALGRIGLLVVAMMPDTVVGIVLLQTTTNPFPRMFPGMPWGPDPVQDVQTGGAVMWVGGDALMMVFAVGVLLTVLTGRSQTPLLGTWLESVRRSTLDDLAGARLTDDGEDLDEEQSALDAYNRMLERRAMQDRH